MEQAIRERSLPGMSRELIMECRTFVRQKTLPSPRAQEGCNDDRVMACALALEMFRQYGTHPHRHRPKTRKSQSYAYPWQRQGRRVA
jgi:hypothetical protein